MSIAMSANVLLNSMEQAEKDLALYAAIIGCKPTVSPDAPPIAMPSIGDVTFDVDAAHPTEPGRISIWMRHVSHEAKKRFNEAATRLAS